MALDNAQFISELSIVDPPGTDAIAEGDDHIRTVKRATQQSFPNVDAAVPQTAAQMGQMAIKNEVNTFTQVNHFTNRLDIDAANLRFELGGFDQGIQFRNTDVLQWQILGAAASANGDLEFLRYTGGIFQERTIVIERATGTITFDSLDNIFKQSATFQFVAQFNSTAARCRATNAGNETGLLYISDIATLRWGAIMESTADGNSYTINRYDSNGTFLNQPFRIAGNGNIVMQRTTQRLSINRDGGTETMQMGGLTDGSAFLQGRTAAGDINFIFRADAGSANSWVAVGQTQGRFGVGTANPLRTLHVEDFGSLQLTPLRVSGLPTSSAGLTSGDCWISSGFIAIIP